MPSRPFYPLGAPSGLFLVLLLTSPSSRTSSKVPSGAYAMSDYLLQRVLLIWMPRCKYLRASGISVRVRACKLGWICRDSSGRNVVTRTGQSDSFPTGQVAICLLSGRMSDWSSVDLLPCNIVWSSPALHSFLYLWWLCQSDQIFLPGNSSSSLSVTCN